MLLKDENEILWDAVIVRYTTKAGDQKETILISDSNKSESIYTKYPYLIDNFKVINPTCTIINAQFYNRGEGKLGPIVMGTFEENTTSFYIKEEN